MYFRQLRNANDGYLLLIDDFPPKKINELLELHLDSAEDNMNACYFQDESRANRPLKANYKPVRTGFYCFGTF